MNPLNLAAVHKSEAMHYRYKEMRNNKAIPFFSQYIKYLCLLTDKGQ